MVVHPPFAWQLGSLTCILSLALQLALVVQFLRVLFYHMVQNLRDGVTPAGSRLVMSSIGTKVWSEPYLICWLILCDEANLWVETVLGLILDCDEDFFTFYLVGSGPSRWGHPFRVEFAMWAYALDQNEGRFSEPYSKILWDEVTLWVKCGCRSTLDHERRFSLVVRPRSFRMGSPF